MWRRERAVDRDRRQGPASRSTLDRRRPGDRPALGPARRRRAESEPRARADRREPARDADGTVAVAGFYDGVVELVGRRSRGARADAVRRRDLPVGDRRRRRCTANRATTTLERLWTRPTLEVNELRGGGPFTVIPRSAQRAHHVPSRPGPAARRGRSLRSRRTSRASRRRVSTSGSRRSPARCPRTRSRADHPAVRAGGAGARARSTRSASRCSCASAARCPPPCCSSGRSG